MLSIFHYLICALGFLVLILALCVMDRTSLLGLSITQRDRINGRGNRKYRLGYFVMVSALAIYGEYVAREYMYPTDAKVMHNTDCHVITHKGFEFVGGEFCLANGGETDSTGFPQAALWDDKAGIAKITGGSVYLKDFVEPFYVRRAGEQRFVLQNPIISEDVSEGFTIQRGGEERCKIEIRYDSEGKSADYILTTYVEGEAAVADTSGFHEVIKRGYPLYDIVSRVPSVDMDKELETIFSNSYLAREVYGDRESRLVFMPGVAFYAIEGVTVNGKPCPREYEKEISGIDGGSFYAGIGKKSTDQMRVRKERQGGEAVTRLEYAVPHTKRLRPINGSVYVTSALGNVDYKMRDGGYLFNIFEREDNHNHVCAYFRYAAGRATDSLRVEVVDLYSDREDCAYVSGSEEFRLSTKEKGNATRWIFEITDLREANPLKLPHLALLLFIFLLVVGIRMYLDECVNESKNLSYFELGVYVVLICFTVVRFILCWRISTYIPMENISPFVYHTMRGNSFGVTYFILAIPVVLMVRPYVSKIRVAERVRQRLETRVGEIRTEKIQHKELRRALRNLLYVSVRWRLTIIYAVILGACLVLGKAASMERICNILIPVVSYFIFDILTIKWSQGRVSQRVVNLLLAFVYLAKADGGFAVIFLFYSFLHVFVVHALFHRYRRREALPYIISAVSLAVLFLALRFEGGLIILGFRLMAPVFGVLNWVILGVGVVALVLVQTLVKTGDGEEAAINRKEKTVCMAVIAVAAGCMCAWLTFHPVTEKLYDKTLYMRYRAEIQDLDSHQNIDDLILDEEFNSKSIEYIMRSAHNQWFINQYLAAGDSLQNEGMSYRLQPHSVQGVTYPTQTTDLVVTRYVLAEHEKAGGVVFMLMLLFVFLVLLYIAEVQMAGDVNEAPLNRAAIGGPLLLYSIALSVFLSATNRIVFVGQDFPFLSAQSNIAVILPVMLLMVTALRSQGVRSEGQRNTERDGNHRKGVVLFCLVLAFTGCTLLIERKGESQRADQFNVSEVISKVSEKASVIDRAFFEYQNSVGAEKLKTKSPAEVWADFESSSYGQAVLGDTALTKERFFGSLLHYFMHDQVNKANPNEFLHLRRRDNLCHFSVNKKQFFIPSIMQEREGWSGNLLAAAVENRYSICDMETGEAERVTPEVNYRLNILPVEVQRRVPGIQVYQFAESWTPDHKPLILVDSKKSLEAKQYFSIISDTSEYKGYGNGNQIAMALGWNDKFILYTSEKGKEGEVVYVRKLKEETDNCLACNIWLNGKRRLFYPLGKESMWSYQIANLMSEAYRHTQFKDSTIRLSIDYELHKRVYEKIEEESQREGDKGFDFSAVAIDGDGRIRLMLDYTNKRDVDPNDIIHINKLRSELYSDGRTCDEIDIFGNKALQYVVPGPGSSLKPIAYTAITSQEKMEWETIDVCRDGQDSAVLRDEEGNAVRGKYLYYGGVGMERAGEEVLNIEDVNALRHDNYLVYSDNLYNSVMMMLGMQPAGKVEEVFRAASGEKDAKMRFPTFTYRGEKVCFDSGVWFKGNKLQLPDNSLFGEGMWKNFRIQQNTVRVNRNPFVNNYGKSEEMETLYKRGGSNRCWTFPLTSSQNLVQRKTNPQIRNGFNQILLGAYPLQITPLQMAMNAYRMVTMNAGDDIFTVLDKADAEKREKRFFDIGDSWKGGVDEYVRFVSRQVWRQLAQVPTTGTASELGRLASELRWKGYHLYCKTGTLNVKDDTAMRNEESKSPRVKHLMVVVADRALESVTTASELENVRFYVMYFSYYGVDVKKGFTNKRFEDYIRMVVGSELFESYMKK